MFAYKVLSKIMQKHRGSYSPCIHKTGHQNCRRSNLESTSFVAPNTKSEFDTTPFNSLIKANVFNTKKDSDGRPFMSPARTSKVATKFSNQPEGLANSAVQVRRSALLSSSFVSPRKPQLKLEKSPRRKVENNSTQTNRFPNVEKGVNAIESMVCSATQTSKTVISMPILINRGQMSPDSLSPRPELINASSNYTLDGSVTEDDHYIPYTRKNCVINYVRKPQKERLKHLPSDNSLTHTFLERNKLKNAIPEAPTRSEFLEQTSPLRKLMDVNKLKSHSFVESPKKINHNHTRFFVKNVREKPEVVNYVKPVRYFCQKELHLDTDHPKEFVNVPQSKNFMSPTISSEKKNQSKDIENISKLISPTRRGRSASPKHRMSKNAEVRKVPYIDKSSTFMVDVEPSTGDGDTGDDLHIDLKSSLSTTGLQSVTSTASTEGILYQAIAKLRDSDWNISLRGLAEVVEVCRITDTDFIFPHMTTINQRIIELLRSPRSHVCRTTCQAVGHLFEYVKDTRRPEFDEIIDTLLNRTADSNKFIRHDANLALDCMVTHIPTFHAIRALCVKGPEHKNPLVRIATARLIVCCVVIAGAQSILHPNSNNYTRRRVVVNMVRFLNDKSSQTRQYGERLYKLLSKDRVFDIYLKKYLEKDVIVHLKKVMKNSYARKEH